jgi:hypothetical protein
MRLRVRSRRRDASRRLLFEAIPGGISLLTRGQGRIDVLVNHETSTVPFPSTPWVAKELGDDNFPPPGADFFYEREGGQLVLLRLPGTQRLDAH